DRAGLDLLEARDMRDGAAEAGRVAGREELLGVGAGRARAAQALGHREGEVERAVVALGAAVAPARGGGLRGVEDLLGGDGDAVAHDVLLVDARSILCTI